jgi:hypothetical protein
MAEQNSAGGGQWSCTYWRDPMGRLSAPGEL